MSSFLTLFAKVTNDLQVTSNGQFSASILPDFSEALVQVTTPSHYIPSAYLTSKSLLILCCSPASLAKFFIDSTIHSQAQYVIVTQSSSISILTPKEIISRLTVLNIILVMIIDRFISYAQNLHCHSTFALGYLMDILNRTYLKLNS